MYMYKVWNYGKIVITYNKTASKCFSLNNESKEINWDQLHQIHAKDNSMQIKTNTNSFI